MILFKIFLSACDSLPAPNVTVSGYDVDVLFPAAKDCFNPVSYLVIFCVYKKHTDCNGKSFDAPVSHPKVNRLYCCTT